MTGAEVKRRRRRNPTDLVVREKFDRCVSGATAGGYAYDPEAVCAKVMRRKYGKQFQRISAEGRSLAAARRHARGMVMSRRTGRLARRPRSRIRMTAIERRGRAGIVARQTWAAKNQRRLHGRRLNPYVRRTSDEWEIQGNYGYGHGWEAVTTETSRDAARETIRLYRENEPGVPFRIVKRRVRIPVPEIGRANPRRRKARPRRFSNPRLGQYIPPGGDVIEVLIDGRPNVLTYDQHSGSRGHQYLSRGNRSSHAFPWLPKVGDRFRYGGHTYTIVRRIGPI